MQSSSSPTGGERRKKKKTKETDEEEETSINKTKTNGWRIFDVHIDATEDVGKDDFSISKPILERVCKVLHLDVEDIEDDIERKMKKTSIETILQRNDDYMMKQRIRVARKSCDARGGGGVGLGRRGGVTSGGWAHRGDRDRVDDYGEPVNSVEDKKDEAATASDGDQAGRDDDMKNDDGPSAGKSLREQEIAYWKKHDGSIVRNKTRETADRGETADV